MECVIGGMLEAHKRLFLGAMVVWFRHSLAHRGSVGRVLVVSTGLSAGGITFNSSKLQAEMQWTRLNLME